MDSMKKMKLAIIGTGGMAKLFAKLLKEKFSEIAIISRSPERTKRLSKKIRTSYATLSEINKFEVVFLTTPPRYLPNIVKAISHDLRPGSLVMDISSVKSGIIDEVSTLLPSGVEYLSLHPLFGPSTKRIKGNNIVVIPVRGKSFLAALKELFEGLGLTVVVTSPEEHDRIMAVVQVAHHLSSLSLALTLWNLLGPKELKSYATRSLRKTVQNFKLFQRNLRVIREISELNPYKEWALNELEVSIKKLMKGDGEAWERVEEALRDLPRTCLSDSLSS